MKQGEGEDGQSKGAEGVLLPIQRMGKNLEKSRKRQDPLQQELSYRESYKTFNFGSGIANGRLHF